MDRNTSAWVRRSTTSFGSPVFPVFWADLIAAISRIKLATSIATAFRSPSRIDVSAARAPITWGFW